MTMNDYMRKALATATSHTDENDRLINACLGLAGESGEFCDLVKKAMYHKREVSKDQPIRELGDVLWYVALAASALGVDLETVAETNLAKLAARYPEGHFSSSRANNRAERDT